MSFTKNPIKIICQKCGEEFRPVAYLGKKRIRLYSRRYCFKCIPYKPASEKNNLLYNSITKGKGTLDGKRQCILCFEFKETVEFSPTNKKGNLNSYCKPCAAKRKKSYTQKFKEECIAYKGGKCIRCGYSKCPAALEFHHRDPDEKEFKISSGFACTVNEEKVKQELDKCDCLCSNCHKEVHYLVEKEKENG